MGKDVGRRPRARRRRRDESRSKCRSTERLNDMTCSVPVMEDARSEAKNASGREHLWTLSALAIAAVSLVVVASGAFSQPMSPVATMSAPELGRLSGVQKRPCCLKPTQIRFFKIMSGYGQPASGWWSPPAFTAPRSQTRSPTVGTSRHQAKATNTSGL